MIIHHKSASAPYNDSRLLGARAMNRHFRQFLGEKWHLRLVVHLFLYEFCHIQTYFVVFFTDFVRLFFDGEIILRFARLWPR